MIAPLELLQHKGAKGQRIFIYGAGSQGRGVLRALCRNGIAVAGFIDRNPDIQGRILAGLPIVGPSVLEAAGAMDSMFVIVAVFFFEREISAHLESLGFIKGESYLSYSVMKPHDYAVEVSGVCNLHCISCPRAERYPAGRNAMMMGLETFKKVINKIQGEAPFVGNIQLYQWGEPTLNPELPNMIRYAHEKDMFCTISSNLNHNADFRSLMESRPECLRLSVSGMGANYEITHTGGSWQSFIANVEIIGKLRHEIHPEMRVELYYHLYRHNTEAQQKEVGMLCQRLDFEFHPVPAYIISLDDVLAYCEGRPLPAAAQRARALLLVDLDEGLRQARAESGLSCDALRVIMINADLSVSACMMFYDPDMNNIADNYLETPLDKIVARQTTSALCQSCRKHGVHRYCGVYARISEEERY